MRYSPSQSTTRATEGVVGWQFHAVSILSGMVFLLEHTTTARMAVDKSLHVKCDSIPALQRWHARQDPTRYSNEHSKTPGEEMEGSPQPKKHEVHRAKSMGAKKNAG